MKILYLSQALVLLITGVLGANKKAGESCATTGDVCVTTGSYCDDKTTKTCQCNTGFVLMGSTCARVHGQVCDASMCSDENMICKEDLCACDTSSNFAAGAANDPDCACDTANHYIMEDNACKKEASEACNAATDTCVSHATCTGTPSTCTCDTNGHFIPESGLCVCDSTETAEKDGKCYLLNAIPCSSVDQCYPANGKVCAEPSGGGSAVCQCDTTQHWAAAGTTGCACEATYGLTAEGTCRLLHGQGCSSSEECVDNAVCKADANGDNVCTCDDETFYAADGSNLCECDPNKAKTKDGKCYLLNTEQCSSVDQCYPANGKVCAVPSSGGSAVCQCDTTKHWAVAAAGTSGCACDTDYVEENNMCKTKANAACDAASDTCVEHATCTGTQPVCKCHDTYEASSGKCVRTVKLVGEACKNTEDSPSCVVGAICDKSTELCACDSANHFVTASGDTTRCECDTNYVDRNGRCLSTLGQSCVGKDTTNVCVSGATCVDNTTTTAKDFMCTCKGTVKDDGTCNGAAAVVSSLAILMVALLVTSYSM